MKINQVCFRTKYLKEPWSIKTYKSIGGYSAWIKILTEKVSPKKIIEIIKESELRGRGGAGFPTGIKWSFFPYDIPGEKYVICNSDEGEPGTCKDRDIMKYNPHQILEGILIACYTMGANIAYNYIRGEFWLPFSRMETAIKEARKEMLLGDNIQNKKININIYNHLGAGSYICGEETALLNSLEGKKGFPRLKPPFPAVYGLYGKPTNVNNTETYASIPPIIQYGPKWFSSIGRPNNGGSKIFSVTGDVERPGNFEIPLGTKFSKLLDLAGGVRKKNKIKAVIPGGSSSKILTGEEMMNCHMDYDSLGKAGSMLGSGAVIVLDETRNIVKILCRFLKFYTYESCGQCTPCREGSGWILKKIQKILKGKGNMSDIDYLFKIAKNIEGKTICVFGEAFSWPVQSYILKFRNEFQQLIKN